MKKFLIIFSLIFAFVYVQAQDISLSPKATYESYTGTAADTIKGATSLTKVIHINKPYDYFYNVSLDVDTLSGGGGNSVSCILSGSNDNSIYATITDVTFSASADTTFTYSDVSTGVLWEYLKLTLTGDGASAASELQKVVVKIAPKP